MMGAAILLELVRDGVGRGAPARAFASRSRLEAEVLRSWAAIMSDSLPVVDLFPEDAGAIERGPEIASKATARRCDAVVDCDNVLAATVPSSWRAIVEVAVEEVVVVVVETIAVVVESGDAAEVFKLEE